MRELPNAYLFSIYHSPDIYPDPDRELLEKMLSDPKNDHASCNDLKLVNTLFPAGRTEIVYLPFDGQLAFYVSHESGWRVRRFSESGSDEFLVDDGGGCNRVIFSRCVGSIASGVEAGMELLDGTLDTSDPAKYEDMPKEFWNSSEFSG